jgi:hypothetical protein
VYCRSVTWRAAGTGVYALLELIGGLGAAVLLVESLHPASRVNQLLLARIERMASGADLHFDLAQSRARRERLATRAVDFAVLIVGMYVVLQGASIDTYSGISSTKGRL